MALTTPATTHLVFLMVGSTITTLARFAAKEDADTTVERLCETDAYTLSPDIFIFSASFDTTMEVLSGAEAQEAFLRAFTRASAPPPLVGAGPHAQPKLVNVGDSDSNSDAQDGILLPVGAVKGGVDAAASESDSDDDGPPALLEMDDE